MPDSAGWILNFQTPVTTPADLVMQVGGKGANLVRLAQAELPVPEGFILTTAAYREFVSANGMEEKILSALPPGGSIDPDTLEVSSQTIRDLFTTGSLPAVLEADLHFAYAALGSPPVAVRSSATAEDTLELSFAGQQDTFLNIIDDQSLRQAVIN
jgi:pyruvate,water dikinase